jgi:hypothetical protein
VSRSCGKLMNVGSSVHMYIVRGRIEGITNSTCFPRGTESVEDHEGDHGAGTSLIPVEVSHHYEHPVGECQATHFLYLNRCLPYPFTYSTSAQNHKCVKCHNKSHLVSRVKSLAIHAIYQSSI